VKTIIIIPARYASSRFPGKPLAPLMGATGSKKSLIHRSWEAAKRVQGVDRVVISTDDNRIIMEADSFGAESIKTSTSCKNGTERCAETSKILLDQYDIVVNLQGDAPLTPHWFIDALLNELKNNKNANVVTPVLKCDPDGYRMFLEDRKNGRVGGTTVVFNNNKKALYFSKEVIPFIPQTYLENETCPVYHHVGVYAYRPNALGKYIAFPEGTLEQLESLEQLRFIENNCDIYCVEVDSRGQSFWELNNPEDIKRIESKLLELGLE
jgi:3-deoxy-manno-octulosonate cytidylyltransferase (CMP-KDO synthetase)